LLGFAPHLFWTFVDRSSPALFSFLPCFFFLSFLVWLLLSFPAFTGQSLSLSDLFPGRKGDGTGPLFFFSATKMISLVRRQFCPFLPSFGSLGSHRRPLWRTKDRVASGPSSQSTGFVLPTHRNLGLPSLIFPPGSPCTMQQPRTRRSPSKVFQAIPFSIVQLLQSVG